MLVLKNMAFDGMNYEREEAKTVPEPEKLPWQSKIGERRPVDYRYDALDWNFIKAMAQVCGRALSDYNGNPWTNIDFSAPGANPINHAINHIQEFLKGVKHDKLGTLRHQLAAAAANLMYAYWQLKEEDTAPSKTD